MVVKYFNLMVSSGSAEHSNKNYGYLPYVFAFLSSVIWPLSWIYANQNNINMAYTTMIRGSTSFLTNYLICILTSSDITFKSPRTFTLLLIRSIIISIASICVGASQFILPLSIVHTIISSSTLFVFIIDFLVNFVRVNLKQGVGITIGIIGMILASNGRVLETWINPQYKEQSKFQYYITDNVYLIGLFTLFFTVVIALWSYAFVLTKSLKCNPFQINYFLGITSLFTGSILLQFLPQNTQPHTMTSLLPAQKFYKAVLFTGVPLLFDQWFLIGAVIMCKQTGVVSMMSYNSIIIGYLISVFRYGEKPNLFVNVGVILLAIGMYQTLFNMNVDGDEDQDGVSGGEDNEDGTFRKGIHKSMKHPSIQELNSARLLAEELKSEYLTEQKQQKNQVKDQGPKKKNPQILILRDSLSS